MLILLPPSEGKTAPVDGDPVNVAGLAFPELAGPRRSVLNALEKVSADPEALTMLGVGPSLADEVKRNISIRSQPVAPANEVYTGVLYEALSFRTLTGEQQAEARSSILVISALWGAVRFDDDIPAYRLSMSAKLPDLGRLASYWKRSLGSVLDERSEGELLVDCRSSTYAAAWVPPMERTVTVNVFQVRDGKRTVVSHFAKHTRGEFVRQLLQRNGKAPETPHELAEVAAERWDTELVAPQGTKSYRLNLVLSSR
ncbi:peroxide stress protein YaaA [Arthrobacter roseus]|uniref:peroxide stress protein YaaA n=1 Tax=Arthrobacter roseus TaxID=136274 RepID=UPI0019665FF4|nr:cytoplasmic iron level regulating protein YaaA (DUF328/UPF0246 family) [Arthrobacter roseus]